MRVVLAVSVLGLTFVLPCLLLRCSFFERSHYSLKAGHPEWLSAKVLVDPGVSPLSKVPFSLSVVRENYPKWPELPLGI
jgi:hypothetical protein